MKISFVILHYENIYDTIKCVQSVLNDKYPDKDIVIVDNASPNNSGNKLIKQFKNNKSIKVILNKSNEGFAKGNNLGFQYSKNILKSDFICVINNDTELLQNNFCELIINKYKEKHFHILGPDIISGKDGHHQNPRHEVLKDKKTIIGLMHRMKLMYILSFINFDLEFINLKKKFFPKSTVSVDIPKWLSHNKELWNVKLHGSALIFSPDFVASFNVCFHSGTFLYNEESILNHMVKFNNLSTVYFPKVKILHHEDGSTDFILKSKLKKRRLYYKNFINSASILLNYLDNKKYE